MSSFVYLRQFSSAGLSPQFIRAASSRRVTRASYSIPFRFPPARSYLRPCSHQQQRLLGSKLAKRHDGVRYFTPNPSSGFNSHSNTSRPSSSTPPIVRILPMVFLGLLTVTLLYIISNSQDPLPTFSKPQDGKRKDSATIEKLYPPSIRKHLIDAETELKNISKERNLEKQRVGFENAIAYLTEAFRMGITFSSQNKEDMDEETRQWFEGRGIKEEGEKEWWETVSGIGIFLAEIWEKLTPFVGRPSGVLSQSSIGNEGGRDTKELGLGFAGMLRSGEVLKKVEEYLEAEGQRLKMPKTNARNEVTAVALPGQPIASSHVLNSEHGKGPSIESSTIQARKLDHRRSLILFKMSDLSQSLTEEIENFSFHRKQQETYAASTVRAPKSADLDMTGLADARSGVGGRQKEREGSYGGLDQVLDSLYDPFHDEMARGKGKTIDHLSSFRSTLRNNSKSSRPSSSRSGSTPIVPSEPFASLKSFLSSQSQHFRSQAQVLYFSQLLSDPQTHPRWNPNLSFLDESIWTADDRKRRRRGLGVHQHRFDSDSEETSIMDAKNGINNDEESTEIEVEVFEVSKEGDLGLPDWVDRKELELVFANAGMVATKYPGGGDVDEKQGKRPTVDPEQYLFRYLWLVLNRVTTDPLNYLFVSPSTVVSHPATSKFDSILGSLSSLNSSFTPQSRAAKAKEQSSRINSGLSTCQLSVVLTHLALIFERMRLVEEGNIARGEKDEGKGQGSVPWLLAGIKQAEDGLVGLGGMERTGNGSSTGERKIKPIGKELSNGSPFLGLKSDLPSQDLDSLIRGRDLCEDALSKIWLNLGEATEEKNLHFSGLNYSRAKKLCWVRRDVDCLRRCDDGWERLLRMRDVRQRSIDTHGKTGGASA